MNNSTIPKLLELAAHSLLSREAMPALEEFTVDLFPPLLTAAFSKGHKKALKELVQAWPFPFLRLGSLIVRWPNQDSLQAVLDGLEALPANRTCPRKSELRVLDLTLDFEQVQGKGASEALAKFPFWLPSTVKAEIPQATARPKPTENAKKGLRQPWEPVKLHIDLFLRGPFKLDTFLSGLLNRVERSCGSLHLCCRKLHIEEMPFNSLIGILKTLDLNFIQELEVFDWFRALSEQSLFATQLGRMCNLQSLKLAYYHWAFSPDGEQSSSYFLSQLSKLAHLQKLHLSYSYLSGNLHQVLSCLQSPLQTLEIRSCTLLDTDITYLSQSPHATCLKKLDLSGNNLSHVVPGPLETLLQEVSGTLQHLDLNHCRLKDGHLSAILPALCRCSHLSSLGLSDNPVSRAGLMTLLEHTTGLMELKRVLYPIPVECCVYLQGLSWGPVNKGKLCQVQAELQKVLQAVQRADMQWSPPLPSPLPVRLVQLD
ncbi:melanoma antigen preferentially expressed in tumors isoform X1 [Talpa occidentalis]|uniref:melanoma antigen preferentially expressed in tumors isoform X1 n=1 Tax=Talpa occidentalis TaxID=50954 RepID=UPI00188E7F9F|nr:melanoma antigen preferentially expressed in tumors isoform X1 [Talpa occidentalis]XP_037353194.1 melanoma antigen preferentially expressed in tumors isoform X1 [Talpa occidentalis]XP_037353195.1 melanoma antigen preferentially expressed in tumors isoform X1 [Talpa occidentalis]